MGFEKITEQASFYDNLEKKPLRELLNDINTEDQKVAHHKAVFEKCSISYFAVHMPAVNIALEAEG